MDGGRQKPYAIVIGIDHMNGLQTARIFADRGVPVIGVARDPKHYCCKTNTCERILTADHGTDDLILALEELGPTLAQKAVLVPCLDPNVRLISEHRERLEKWFHVVLAPKETVSTLMNKELFYQYALENDIPISATRFLNSKADVEQAGAELRFPCVVKPPMRTAQWNELGTKKAYKVNSPEELFELYEHFKGWSEALIIQEWVVGPESNLYSCNVYFNRAGKPLATFVARKLRQWPPITGESSLGEEIRNDFVLEETIKLFEGIGYYGLGYVEFKKDERTGDHFIIEPNIGRPTGRSAIAEAGGVEILYTMYCDVLGLELPPNPGQQYNGVKWIGIRRDFQSAVYHWRHSDLTIREYFRSIQGPKAYALYSPSDLGPFVGDLIRSAKLLLSPGRSKRSE
ncbi:carboxylate--amine ligase [bacterium]|nr:carboxylate--amine ligase [bacterium]